MLKHLELLGREAVDRVTGFKGVVTTVSFDLYGCVQVVLSPRLQKEGSLPDGRWFDVNRQTAAFARKDVTGPAEKPAR